VTYFTDGPIVRQRRDITEFQSSLGEVAGAAFTEAITTSPILGASSELETAQLGEIITGEQLPVGSVGVQRRAPTTPILTAEEARNRVKESGLPLTIDGDIREGALNILMRRKQEELQRQTILASGPRGSAPVAILASFAASALDPLNIASAFIPVVGEARYARMLERAASSGSRFGVRAGVGALEGAVGAAIVEPLVLQNAREYQMDYDQADSLLNVAFGTVLGGGLHSIGGAVSDLRRGRLTAQPAPDSQALYADSMVSGQGDILSGTPDTRMAAALEPDIRPIVDQQMRADVAFSARQRAVDELAPDIRAQLEAEMSGRTVVRELKSERAELERTLETLDDTYKARAKAFQDDGLTRKQAERAARDQIEQVRQTTNERIAQIDEVVAGNRQAEVAAGELSQLRRGEIPDRFLQQVAEREEQIRQGVMPKALAGAVRQTARDIAESAPHYIRQSALKTAIAQAMTGRDVDVENLFRLTREPEQAVQRIAEPQARAVDGDGEASSLRADDLLKSAKDDLADLEESVQFDEDMARQVAEQTGFDIKAELKDADAVAAEAETYTKAWHAAALCGIRH
jgi:hypothetical protein